jgi:hypothetical protein
MPLPVSRLPFPVGRYRFVAAFHGSRVITDRAIKDSEQWETGSGSK